MFCIGQERESTTDYTDNTDKNKHRRRKMGHELIHKELSEAIVGAAMTVLNALKP